MPDLACWDVDGELAAFVESKFWASLTPRQPVDYWEALPSNRPSVLLFLAPATRVDEGTLWVELVERLQSSGQELGWAKRSDGLIAEASKTGQRRLMLTSWKFLLGKLALSAKHDGCDQASLEIAKRKGLATDAIEGEDPQPFANLKQLSPTL